MLKQFESIILKLETVTKVGIASPNGYIYSEEEFNKAVDNIKLKTIYLTNTSNPLNNCDSLLAEYVSVDIRDILGEIIEIGNGYIKVRVSDQDKLDKINNLLITGYKPGMRYIATVNKDHYVKDIRIICYDMIDIDLKQK